MLKNREGERVPEVTFKLREGAEWRERTSAEIFDGRTVVLFALPGAFTPTCSSTHVPGYDRLAPVLAEHGVDEVICLSVNDAFVMDAWQKDQDAHRVTFLADGSGAFTSGMGMLVNKDDLGFGMRSWRYSMLVRDGVVEKMFIEPEVEGDPFEVSDAETMLRHVAPAADVAEDVTLFTRPGCPHCARAKALLDEQGLAYEEIVVGRDASMRSVFAVSGGATVPQVFIGGRHIGGADELEKHLANA